MNVLSMVMAVFGLIGAADYIFGSKLGLGKEFEKGINMLSIMMLSMVGMILLAPVIANLMTPLTNVIVKYTPFDPSIVSGMIVSNDMGGAPLCETVAVDAAIGSFNGLIVAAMLGSTITYSIPLALSAVDKKYHPDMLFGILCGIGTVPIGCFVSGILLKIPMSLLLLDLVPVIVFSALVILGLLKFPALSIKIFSILGKIILTLIIAGLAAGIFDFLTGITIIPGLAPLSEGVDVIVNTSCIMTGSFSLIFVVSRILNKPLSALGSRLGINSTSAVGFLASAASFALTVGLVPDMDKKGRILNLAFSVSGAFVLAGHLAFTMAYNSDYVFPLIVGKVIAGFTAIIVAALVYKKVFGNHTSHN